MKKMTLLVLLPACILLTACQPNNSSPNIPNLTTKHSGLPLYTKTVKPYANYLYKGGFTKDQEAVAKQAEHYLVQRVKQGDKKLAIVFDVDDTLLQSDSLLDYTTSYKPIFKQHLKANNPLIKPTADLFHLAQQHNVTVFLITGRGKNEKAPTIRNLRKKGLTGYKNLYFATSVDKKNSARYKTSIRKKITEAGYKIIINVGDQYSDLCGGYSERNYKLPNPFYYVPGCKELKNN